MNKEKFLIVGAGGRESAFAMNLAEDSELYAVMPHQNPTIVDCVVGSGGSYIIGNPCDPSLIAQYAINQQIDYAFVSADDPLAAGVVDSLIDSGIAAVGGSKEATRIEWDKIYSIDLVNKVCPKYTPFYRVLDSIDQISDAIAIFEDKAIDLVVKPQGLTGGKGVKLMPEHLPSYAAVAEYSKELLTSRVDEKVLLVEKIEGIEFTIMGLTDGSNLVLCPASYDYPFRLEDDLGAGTGGMGCFTDSGMKLPFMSEQDLANCRYLMQSVIDEISSRGFLFNGVLNGGFFVTSKGIKFMEFNARFGDPEALNIFSLLKSPLSQLIRDLWHKRLCQHSVDFLRKASVIKYLVAKEYPSASKDAIDFEVDIEAVEQSAVQLYFSSALKKKLGHYQTLKRSRVLALGAVADTIEQASQQVNRTIDNHITGNLEYRKDIGTHQNLAKLQSKVKSLNVGKT